MGELLDFKDRGNFDFFKFSSYYGDQKRFKNVLIADCEKVLEYSYKTIQDICLLGYSLKELKESGRWQWVKNPETGCCFEGGEFTKFSKYAFGFSETKTSDLLRISKFLRVKGENEVYLPERYKDYKTSQLVELASVDGGRLHYFNPEMTVEEMRLVKKYLETLDCWNERRAAKSAGREFDALAHAKAWKEQEEQKKNGNKVQPLNEVLDGQITLEELEEVEETPEENPTSDLASSCEADESDEIESAREAARQAGIPFSDKPFEGSDDDFNPHVYDGSMSVADYKRMQEEIAEDDEDYAEPPEGGYYQGGGLDYDFGDDIGCDFDTCKYNFKTRAGVREFLTDSEKWPGRSGYWWFQPACCYTFRNGAMLYALKYTSITDVNTFHRKDCVLYFIKYQGAVSEITKEQFEQYCAAHKDEL